MLVKSGLIQIGSLDSRGVINIWNVIDGESQTSEE